MLIYLLDVHEETLFSIKNNNCFGWSLHNRYYFFTFFRLAQNVDVECQTRATEEDTEKKPPFSVLCAFVDLSSSTSLCAHLKNAKE